MNRHNRLLASTKRTIPSTEYQSGAKKVVGYSTKLTKIFLMSGDDGRVSVCLRVRPMLDFEKSSGYNQIVSYPQPKTIVLGNDRMFSFDHVKSETSSQNEVYEDCARPLLGKFLEGYNGTVIAYGQTGSGKTYTMGTGGSQNLSVADYGIVPRMVHDMFAYFSNHPDTVFDVKVSFLEIYNEEIHDQLLENTSVESGEPQADTPAIRVPPPVIRETPEGGIVVSGATEENTSSAEEMLDLLQKGTLNRSVGATLMNTQSSRSHAIFTVHLGMRPSGSEDQVSALCKSIKCKLNFVDLAGSERLKRTGAQGERMKEGISINCGLLALGNVISALSENKGKRHIPFRDSKITRLLQDSLGGNSKTVMVACVSGADMNEEESLNTLKYASRASTIRNRAVINTDAVGARIQELSMQNRAYNEHIVVLEALQRSHGLPIPELAAAVQPPVSKPLLGGERPLPTLVNKGVYSGRYTAPDATSAYSSSAYPSTSNSFTSMLSNTRNSSLVDSVHGVIASNRLNKTIQALCGYSDLLQRCTLANGCSTTVNCNCEGCQLGSKVILKKLLNIATDEKEEDEEIEDTPPSGDVPRCGMCAFHKERSELKNSALQEAVRVIKLLTRPKKKKEANVTMDNAVALDTSIMDKTAEQEQEEQEDIDNEISELMNTSTSHDIEEEHTTVVENTASATNNSNSNNNGNSNGNSNINSATATLTAILPLTSDDDDSVIVEPSYEQDIENLLCNVGVKNSGGVVAKTTTTVLMLTQLSQKYHQSDLIDQEENLDVEIVEKQELLHLQYASKEESEQERVKLEEKIVQMRREIVATEAEKNSVVKQLETVNEKAEAARVSRAYQERLKSLQTKLRVVERQAKEAETFRTKFLNDEARIKLLEGEVTSAKREKLKVLKELKKKKDEFKAVTSEQKKELSAMAREKNKLFSLVEKYKKEHNEKQASQAKKRQLVGTGYVANMVSSGNSLVPTATGYHITTSASTSSTTSNSNSNNRSLPVNHIHCKNFNTTTRDLMSTLREGVVSGVQVSQLFLEMKQVVRDMRQTEDSLKPLELAYADCGDGDLDALERLIEGKQQFLRRCKLMLQDLNDVAFELVVGAGNHSDLVSNELLVKALHCDADEPSVGDILHDAARRFSTTSQMKQEKHKLESMIKVLNVDYDNTRRNSGADDEKHMIDELLLSVPPSDDQFENNLDFAKSESALHHVCFTLKRHNNLWWFQNDVQTMLEGLFTGPQFDCIECTKTICKDLLYLVLHEWSVCKLSASACITELNSSTAVQEVEAAEHSAQIRSANEKQHDYRVMIAALREKEQVLQANLDQKVIAVKNDRAPSMGATADECPLCGHHKKRYMLDTESTKIRTLQTQRVSTAASANATATNNNNNNSMTTPTYQPPTPLSTSINHGFSNATAPQSQTPTNVVEAAFHAPKGRHSIHIAPKEPHSGRSQRTVSASHSPRQEGVVGFEQPGMLVLESDDTLASLPEGLFFTPTARGGLLNVHTGLSLEHLPSGGPLGELAALSVVSDEEAVMVTEEEVPRIASPKAMTEGGIERKASSKATERLRRGSAAEHGPSVHDRQFTQTTRSSQQRIRSTTISAPSSDKFDKADKPEFVTSLTASASTSNLSQSKKNAVVTKDKKKGSVLPPKKPTTPMAAAFGLSSLEDLAPPEPDTLLTDVAAPTTEPASNEKTPMFAPGMRFSIVPARSSPIDLNNVLVDTEMIEDPPPAPPTLTGSTCQPAPPEKDQVML